MPIKIILLLTLNLLLIFSVQADSDLNFSQVGSGFDAPVVISSAKFDNLLFVAEQCGKVYTLNSLTSEKNLFIDLSARISCNGEQGLLGLAFAPRYKRSRNFYVHYNDLNGNTVLSRFKAAKRSLLRGNRRSEEILLQVEQPFSNHNGGPLEFGPDKFLYFGLGDGGSGGDPLNLAQNKKSLLGKILRLNVESPQAIAGKTYTIPESNPFANSRGRDEIWALGLRNPWKLTFDRLTGDLWTADVGQGDYEEINFTPANSAGGINYGWKITEGTHCFEPSSGCDTSALTLPIYEYDHNPPENNCSVTGGYVFRSDNYPSSTVQGNYIFGDLCSGILYSIKEVSGNWQLSSEISTGFTISTFGQDHAGDLYVADYGSGNIYRLVPAI